MMLLNLYLLIFYQRLEKFVLLIALAMLLRKACDMKILEICLNVQN